MRARERAPASLLPCDLCLPPLPPLVVFGGDDLGRQRLTRLGRHLRLLVVLARLVRVRVRVTVTVRIRVRVRVRVRVRIRVRVRVRFRVRVRVRLSAPDRSPPLQAARRSRSSPLSTLSPRQGEG